MTIALTPVDCYRYEKQGINYKTIDDFIKIKDLSIEQIKESLSGSIYDMYKLENKRTILNYEEFNKKVSAEEDRI